MKKILLLSANLFISFFSLAQTIVSTTPENKNVVLEEFTGIHCGFCPEGHARAKAIQDAHPDDVVIINVHTGTYAVPNPGEPDFRTSFGLGIENQSDLTGYPSGTVNRHVFPGHEMTGGGTAQGRGDWSATSSIILSESSYVNLAMEAEIDVQTRILTIHVEAYYTDDSPKSTNKLNVVLMQNNTLGPQSGGNMGNEYVHMHRLVHMITGQWGEDITTTTQGSFINETYTYTIPAEYKGVAAILQDVEVAAFVAEGQQEIISGVSVKPSFNNLSYDNNASLDNVIIAEKICGNKIIPTIKLQNNGNNSLTSVEISYNVNDGTDSTFNWNGDLGALKLIEFDLDKYEFTPEQTNKLNIEIKSIGDETDEDQSDNSNTVNFEKSEEVNNLLTLTLSTDQYANEISWKLFNSSGTEVDAGGGYSNNTTNSKTFHLDLDCYMFEIYDSYGDGGATFSLEDSEGLMIHSSTGNYGIGENVPFKTISEVQTFSATFNVTNGTNPVENAEINLTDFGMQTTDAFGVAVFSDIYPNENIDYIISITGFDAYSGTVSVVDANLNIDANIIRTGLEDVKKSSFSIYPNPTDGILFVKQDEKVNNAVLKIVTLKGEEILSQDLGFDKITPIYMGRQPKGLYFVKILGSDFVKTMKFILE